MKGRLEGKVILISGAAGGQGEAEAKLFTREGAKVVIFDIKKPELDQVAKDIADAGGEALAIYADVTKEEDWINVVALAMKRFGKIDVLVNNAGVNESCVILDETVEHFRRVLDIDTVGLFIGTKHVVPEMIKAGNGGVILNTSSIYGPKFGSIAFSAYGTAKSGVTGLTKATAAEFAQYGIRVNSIHPGFILSPMTINRPKEVHEKFETKTPLRRLGAVEDVAYGALYLVSDEASFVTGAELYIDGGISFQSPIN